MGLGRTLLIPSRVQGLGRRSAFVAFTELRTEVRGTCAWLVKNCCGSVSTALCVSTNLASPRRSEIIFDTCVTVSASPSSLISSYELETLGGGSTIGSAAGISAARSDIDDRGPEVLLSRSLVVGRCGNAVATTKLNLVVLTAAFSALAFHRLRIASCFRSVYVSTTWAQQLE